MLNLINNQPDVDKTYLYAKDQCEAKYQFLINKPEKIGLKACNNPKVFSEHSNDMQNLCKNFEEYSSGKDVNY